MRKVIALEGIPGAGKTSCLAALFPHASSRLIFLSEMNPEPGAPWERLGPEGKGDLFDQLWVERAGIIENSGYSFLLDRSYLSNLAFWYAIDQLEGTEHYARRKEFALAHFSKHFFDVVILLECPGDVSINRRIRGSVPCDPPWNLPTFLKGFSDFYHRELSDYVSGRVVSLNTGTLSLDAVVETIKNLCCQDLHPHPFTPWNEAPDPSPFEKFAREARLGSPLTTIGSVLGYPTVYYRQHSLQVEDGQATFFNNNRLKRILSEPI